MSSWFKKNLAVGGLGVLTLGGLAASTTLANAQNEKPPISATAHGHNQTCRANLREIHRALSTYVQTNSKFPEAQKWTDSLTPLVSSQDVFNCPASPGGKWGYAMNQKLSGKSPSKVPAPHITNAVHETSDLRPNAVGKGDNMAHRHQTTEPEPSLSHAVTVQGQIDFAKSSRRPYFGLIPPARH